ncbi:MAG TPA: citramalate synthase [Pseudobacteroides sp.]|uniref:homocitrate synthase/isopropylmalate synthase family protein n=1 Tax=Pseudobacteroides sp. TaxID=1968840 RepID=UPI002F94724C
MALFLGNNRILKIIDRTLPEVFAGKNNFSGNDVLSFCNLVKIMGIDLFEVDSAVMKKVKKMPKGIDFIYRANSEYEVEECIRRGIKYCVVKWIKLINPYFCDVILKSGLAVTVEYKVENIGDLYKLDKMLAMGKLRSTGKLRIKGLDRVVSDGWLEILRDISKKYNMDIDICPDNTYSIATALSLEGIMGGVNTVTGTFMGYGSGKGFAAIEEVLMATRLLMDLKTNTKLDILPQLKKSFCKLTGLVVPDNKPVLGEDIFKYESGIHADGIEKDPSTYEPFNPLVVGQQRKLVIGKHSGKKSVCKKLKELGHDVDEDKICTVLDMVRTKSIHVKRELYDHELKDIVLSRELCCL